MQQRYRQFISKLVDKEVCGIAGNSKYIRTHIAQLQQISLQLRQRRFTLAENCCAAVRDIAVTDHIYNRMLLVAVRRASHSELTQELCSGCRAKATDNT